MSHTTTYAVDFDGTLCENAYPEIGAPNLPLIDKLISCRRLGAKIILWTCREGEAADPRGGVLPLFWSGI